MWKLFDLRRRTCRQEDSPANFGAPNEDTQCSTAADATGDALLPCNSKKYIFEILFFKSFLISRDRFSKKKKMDILNFQFFDVTVDSFVRNRREARETPLFARATFSVSSYFLWFVWIYTRKEEVFLSLSLRSECSVKPGKGKAWSGKKFRLHGEVGSFLFTLMR